MFSYMPCVLRPGDGDVGKQHKGEDSKPEAGVAREPSRETQCCGSGQRVRTNLLGQTRAEGGGEEGQRDTGESFLGPKLGETQKIRRMN